jgi:type IV pilus assembly protein PilQ
MPPAPKKDQPVYAQNASLNGSRDSIILAGMQQASAAPKEDPAAVQADAVAAIPAPVLVPRSSVARRPVEESIPPVPASASEVAPATPGVPAAVATPSPAPSSASAPGQPALMAAAALGHSQLAAPPQPSQGMPQGMSQGIPQAMPGPSGVIPQQSAVPAKRYTGEIISINVKGADLRDFFRLIQEISGLNVIIDDAVHGNLTMTLNDVPWDQALDIVLHNYQLEPVLSGNVLRIATLDAVRQEQKAAADLAAAQQDTVERVTVTRNLSYAKAGELMATIKKFLTKRGDIIAYDRNNQLIITDTPAGIAVADNLLSQLDRWRSRPAW